MRTILTVLGRLLRVRRVPASKRSVEEMECQVALLREKVRYLQVLAMRPGQVVQGSGALALARTGGEDRSQAKRRVSEIALVKSRQALPGMRTSGVDRKSQTSDA